MSKDLGRRLEELRIQNKLDRDDLAKKLSVKKHDVRHWEDGRESPDGEQLIKLSQIYKMPIDEILLNFDTENNFQNSAYAAPAGAAVKSKVYIVADGNPPLKPTYNWYMFPYPVIAVAAYLIIGFFFNRWHPTWLLFLTIPIYYMLVVMHGAKSFRAKANVFPYPIICVLFYLAAGFDYGWWHPMWILFLTIPVYYTIVNGIKTR
ncbi:MAG: helix-turn-helix domain-containing protein [Oscillospiraceae bacterium]|nr:helix-turn-helix domain-containing protein [Oscillospiraceae bacterium]